MPKDFSPSDDSSNLAEQRSGKDRRQKVKPRFDDDDTDPDADQPRRDKKDRRGDARTHRSLHNDDD